MAEEPEDKLIAAVRTGSIEAVQLALQAGEGLETYSKYGETPLGVAAQMGDLEMMCFLSGLGVDLDEDDYEGDTPLCKAIWAKQFGVVDWLLEQGNEDTRAKRSVEALHLAAEYGNVELARELLDRGVDVDARDERELTPLHIAVQIARPWYDAERAVGRMAVTRLLIDRGANVHSCCRFGRNAVTFEEQGSISILHSAAFNGNKEVVDMLRQAGAAITLIEAAEIGDADATRDLLACGDDPNAPDFSGDTPLGLAAGKGHAEVVSLLLQHGVDACQPKASYEDTALSVALDGKHDGVVALLLDHSLGEVNAAGREQSPAQREDAIKTALTSLLIGRGRHINALKQDDSIDDDDMTPLMTAVAHETEAKARLLLRAGADVNIQNSSGYTALMCAAQSGKVGMLRLLLAAGADVSVINEGGNNALLCAVVEGAHSLFQNCDRTEDGVRTAREQGVELVSLLINAGTNVNVSTPYNRTALEYAVENGDNAIVDLLRAAGATTFERE